MKVRNGFISNSSSMSFVIKDKVRTSLVVAQMARIVEKEWEDEQQDKRYFKCLCDTMQFLEDHPGFDNNVILWWTCNFPTYIFRLDPEIFPGRSSSPFHIHVYTCNNHAFWRELDLYQIENTSDEDSYYDITKLDMFFWEFGAGRYVTAKEFSASRWNS